VISAGVEPISFDLSMVVLLLRISRAILNWAECVFVYLRACVAGYG
jgi:hypothetical protein